MRAPTDMPRRRARTSGRGRLLLIIAAIVLFVLFTSLRQIAEFWTDFLWFDSVGFSSVFSKSLWLKVQLGLLFTGVFFLGMWASLFVADRISPKFRPLGPDEELLNRYHQMIDRRAGLVRFSVSLFFAIIVGAGMSSQWNEWILFRDGGDFGTVDPQFGLDVGFYVFKLPFLINVVDWLFAAQIIILLVTIVAHYLNGGIRLQAPFDRVTPQVKAHVSVLLALLALTKAADYWLQRYEILFSDRSNVVNGATYTEVHAQLPALNLLLFIALAAFLLFILNIRRRGWVLPVVAVGLWAFVGIAVGEIYPAFVERFIVQPEQSTKETFAINDNIKATRAAYGLDNVKPKDFSYSGSVDEAAKAINANPSTTRNVQLLDPKQINDTFQKLQSQVSPSQFAAVDTDRYRMKLPGGGTELTQVVVANREVNADTIPQKSWEGKQLSYTHGYGLALAAGNAVNQGGSPDWAVADIPVATSPRIDLTVDQPNNYYFNPELNGSTLNYSIVKTGAPEFDFVKRTSDASAAYAGTSGVPLDSFARRAAFALRFSDPNIVISQYITDQSRILYMRRVTERVATSAPFLSFDTNSYPVVVQGHTYYVIDAYTTSEFYPNSQRYGSGVLGSDFKVHPFNYIRNSVKAVVDTYDGSVTLYVVDKNDPVIEAYQTAFPELFTDASEISSELRAHLRYPEDIFRVQTDMWGRYHINDANQFYNKENAWEPPPPPPDRPQNNGATAAQQAQQALLAQPATNKSFVRMAPYYVLNKLQGDEEPNFMIMRSFQPFSDNDSKSLLAAFMVGRSDGNDLGKLEVFQISDKDQVDGPGIVSPRMLTDNAVSSTLTQLNQQGSSVRFSDLLLVPVDRSIMYVRAVYVISDGQSGTQVPVVRKVIVSFGNRVVIKDTLKDALREMFPGSDPQTLEGNPDRSNGGNTGSAITPTTSTPGTSVPGTTPGTGPGTSVPTPDTSVVPGSDTSALINSAAKDLQEAQDAFDRKDLTLYVQKVESAQAKIKQAQALLSEVPSTTTTTTPAT